ncbi:ATP/GTP-binding protein [uncultured Mitsuokella sp.]|uniref:AAA family ATPase n=1 Tax=uncultured Mitsuokella sp. TaxID=453120 RepID=UPI00266FA69E|nr:AAA family ATPase [uncultured Mitsuokella sp.]
MSAVKGIHIKNFTVFRDIRLQTSAGVNVIIGKNGTGKTQLLKLLYVGSFILQNKKGEFYSCFGVLNHYDSLLRNPEEHDSHIQFDTDEETHEAAAAWHPNTEARYHFLCSLDMPSAVYIPVKDMLTNAKGLLAMSEKYQDFPFDQTLMDIIRKANQWKLREVPALAVNILPHLEKLMNGQVVIENEEFYIRKHDGRMVNFAVEAEGLKKIGLLWQLLMNESITEGTMLLWDEPEANLNPEFLPVLVECLLELSRHGVQVFISTHNYLLAKYFDVRRKKDDQIKYHSLYMTKENDVQCETKEHFAELQHNAIMETFNQLMDEVYGLQVGE